MTTIKKREALKTAWSPLGSIVAEIKDMMARTAWVTAWASWADAEFVFERGVLR